jgi:hypothetical protein
MSAEEKTEGPDNKGTWKVKGAYLTEAGVRAQFAATVSSRGEVLVISSSSTKPKTQRGAAHRLSSADYAARRRRRKKKSPGKRTKSRRNPAEFDIPLNEPVLRRLAGENEAFGLFLIARNTASHHEVRTDDTSDDTSRKMQEMWRP